ncbi:MAG TPA: ketoacyl-ACP synthase III [Gemmatimonadaceae bacterium]|nr:ketoacyl-ACP synthase III [Gemmatimonadaceae bacterium]
MLQIHGVGHFHPENVIDNAFLESLDIGTTDEWILERVGIRERRTVLSLDYIRDTRNADPRAAYEASRYTNAQTAARAARMALERAGLEPSDIGMVIAGGCSPQYLTPAESCTVAAELQIQAPAFDINSACSTFVAQLNFLGKMRPETLPDFILIVSAENNTRVVNYSDRATAVLWGDGSSAAVVSPRVPARAAVRRTTFVSDPAGWDNVTIPTGGFFVQDGPAVQRFAIRKTAATAEELLAKRDEDLDVEPWFIGHQANLSMLRSSADRAGVAESRHLYNVDCFGNCGAAGAPGVFSQNWERFSPDDRLALVVVGAGLAWGGALITFSGKTE